MEAQVDHKVQHNLVFALRKLGHANRDIIINIPNDSNCVLCTENENFKTCSPKPVVAQ